VATTDNAADQASLFALQQGEAVALNRLIARWQRPLYSLAYRYVQNNADAEDLVAETFVRLYQQRLRLRPDTRLSAWLFTTLTNLCHNHHRWSRRHPTSSLGPPSPADSAKPNADLELVSGDLSPNVALEKDEALVAVRAAIQQLPHDLKATLLLHYYEHLSYHEIGEITGCSDRGVETRLYRARRQLRDCLANLLNEPTRP
jgi:RNA polymerase sigma-70 factor (ECF subfamily)